jgi:hypothetical protein
MPFKSKAQHRKCRALAAAGEKGWDCHEWAAHTPAMKKLPEYKKTSNELNIRPGPGGIPTLHDTQYLTPPGRMPPNAMDAAGPALWGALLGTGVGSVARRPGDSLVEGVGRGFVRGGSIGAGAGLGSFGLGTLAHKMTGGDHASTSIGQLLGLLAGGYLGNRAGKAIVHDEVDDVQDAQTEQLLAMRGKLKPKAANVKDVAQMLMGAGAFGGSMLNQSKNYETRSGLANVAGGAMSGMATGGGALAGGVAGTVGGGLLTKLLVSKLLKVKNMMVPQGKKLLTPPHLAVAGGALGAAAGAGTGYSAGSGLAEKVLPKLPDAKTKTAAALPLDRVRALSVALGMGGAGALQGALNTPKDGDKLHGAAIQGLQWGGAAGGASLGADLGAKALTTYRRTQAPLGGMIGGLKGDPKKMLLALLAGGVGGLAGGRDVGRVSAWALGADKNKWQPPQPQAKVADDGGLGLGGLLGGSALGGLVGGGAGSALMNSVRGPIDNKIERLKKLLAGSSGRIGRFVEKDMQAAQHLSRANSALQLEQMRSRGIPPGSTLDVGSRLNNAIGNARGAEKRVNNLDKLVSGARTRQKTLTGALGTARGAKTMARRLPMAGGVVGAISLPMILSALAKSRATAQAPLAEPQPKLAADSALQTGGGLAGGLAGGVGGGGFALKNLMGTGSPKAMLLKLLAGVGGGALTGGMAGRGLGGAIGGGPATKMPGVLDAFKQAGDAGALADMLKLRKMNKPKTQSPVPPQASDAKPNVPAATATKIAGLKKLGKIVLIRQEKKANGLSLLHRFGLVSGAAAGGAWAMSRAGGSPDKSAFLPGLQPNLINQTMANGQKAVGRVGSMLGGASKMVPGIGGKLMGAAGRGLSPAPKIGPQAPPAAGAPGAMNPAAPMTAMSAAPSAMAPKS